MHSQTRRSGKTRKRKEIKRRGDVGERTKENGRRNRGSPAHVSESDLKQAIGSNATMCDASTTQRSPLSQSPLIIIIIIIYLLINRDFNLCYVIIIIIYDPTHLIIIAIIIKLKIIYLFQSSICIIFVPRVLKLCT